MSVTKITDPELNRLLQWYPTAANRAAGIERCYELAMKASIEGAQEFRTTIMNLKRLQIALGDPKEDS